MYRIKHRSFFETFSCRFCKAATEIFLEYAMQSSHPIARSSVALSREIKTFKFGKASIFKSLEFSFEFFCERFVIAFKKSFPLKDGTVMSATALQFFNVQDNSAGVEKVLIAEVIAPILAIAKVAMIHSGLFGANSATRSPGFTPRSIREQAKILALSLRFL